MEDLSTRFDKTINKTRHLSQLAVPTKRRLAKLLTTESYAKMGLEVRLSDPINIDFLFVVSGKISVNIPDGPCQIYGAGEYVDYLKVRELLLSNNSKPIRVKSLQSDTRLTRLRYLDYRNFAPCSLRNLINILDFMKLVIPYFDDISKN